MANKLDVPDCPKCKAKIRQIKQHVNSFKAIFGLISAMKVEGMAGPLTEAMEAKVKEALLSGIE